MLGVDDQDKADQNAHGAPKEIDRTIPDDDLGFTISRAGGLDETGKVLDSVLSLTFAPYFLFGTLFFLELGRAGQ